MQMSQQKRVPESKLNSEFWMWFERERDKRGLSYEAISQAGEGRFAGASTIYRASHENHAISLDMIATIASAFGMTRLEVLRKTKFIVIGPADLDGANLELVELFEITKKLSIDQQRDLIRMVRALVDKG